jgi:hypothetical protein
MEAQLKVCAGLIGYPRAQVHAHGRNFQLLLLAIASRTKFKLVHSMQMHAQSQLIDGIPELTSVPVDSGLELSSSQRWQRTDREVQ